MSVEKNNKAKAKVKTLICSLKTTSFTRLPNSLNKEGNKEEHNSVSTRSNQVSYSEVFTMTPTTKT